MDSSRWSAFRPDLRGHFLSRPNRFVVQLSLGETVVEAHCPNPGRMTELLFQGAPVILERAPGPRKLAYTLVAVERPGPPAMTTIPLVSARANAAVQALALPRLFPGARSIRPEFRLGDSRFDFLVEDAQGARHLIEVKACSEVEHGTALFPDAPSDRARKHLRELARWADEGYVPHVLFAVVHGQPTFFSPNRHTDPAFARTLADLAPRVNLQALVFRTDTEGSTELVRLDLPIVLTPSFPDSGHVIRVESEESGWRVSVEWYADGWERAAARAPARRAFPVQSAQDRRPEMREALARCGSRNPHDEGLLFDQNPLGNAAFVDAILGWRHRPEAHPEN